MRRSCIVVRLKAIATVINALPTAAAVFAYVHVRVRLWSVCVCVMCNTHTHCCTGIKALSLVGRGLRSLISLFCRRVKSINGTPTNTSPVLPALSCPAPGLTIKHNLMASKLHLCAWAGLSSPRTGCSAGRI